MKKLRPKSHRHFQPLVKSHYFWGSKSQGIENPSENDVHDNNKYIVLQMESLEVSGLTSSKSSGSIFPGSLSTLPSSDEYQYDVLLGIIFKHKDEMKNETELFQQPSEISICKNSITNKKITEYNLSKVEKSMCTKKIFLYLIDQICLHCHNFAFKFIICRLLFADFTGTELFHNWIVENGPAEMIFLDDYNVLQFTVFLHSDQFLIRIACCLQKISSVIFSL